MNGKKKLRFRPGDWVSLKLGDGKSRAQVVEDRGRFGKEGHRIYRIRLQEESTEPVEFELPEEFLEPAPESAAVSRTP